MNPRLSRTAGWAAILSGIVAVLAMVTLILFFWLEADSGQEHLWGPLSDICPIVQMALLIIVARALFLIQRSDARGLSLTSIIIGVAGMLGVIVLQSLLVFRVISFAQEIRPLLIATGMVGVWIVLVSYLGRRQGSQPSRLARLGMAVGVAFVLEPVITFVAGSADWRTFMSNYLLMAVSAVVFLVVYVGFPIWAIRLGRVLMATGATDEAQHPRSLIPNSDVG